MSRVLGGPEPGDPAPDGALVALDGAETTLSSLWRERPAVVVFLRYFGCPLCQMHVVRLRDDRDSFREAGADVVLIGQGDPEDGARFSHAKHVPFPCLLDPKRELYRAYGLSNGTLVQALGLNALGSMLKADLGNETRQRGLQGGSLMQMPGTFVVDTTGTLRFAHRNRTIADSPSNAVLLSVVDSLSA